MTKTRRDILKSGGALTAVSGCGGGFEVSIPASLDRLPSVPVDIHNHIFNATDIPIAGFAEQVLLRDPEFPIPGGPTVVRSLIQLIVDIVLAAQSTPSAREEHASLNGLQRLEPRDGGDLLREDRRAVTQGLAILENKAQVAAQRRTTAPNVARAESFGPMGTICCLLVWRPKAVSMPILLAPLKKQLQTCTRKAARPVKSQPVFTEMYHVMTLQLSRHWRNAQRRTRVLRRPCGGSGY